MSVKWTKSLLEECRNERGVGLSEMSIDAIKALVVNRNVVEIYGSGYRLRPDWMPTELEEKQFVDAPVYHWMVDTLAFCHPKYPEQTMSLDCATRFCDFAGYVYASADGTKSVCTSVRLPSGKDGPFSAPVAIRFWKG